MMPNIKGAEIETIFRVGMLRLLLLQPLFVTLDGFGVTSVVN